MWRFLPVKNPTNVPLAVVHTVPGSLPTPDHDVVIPANETLCMSMGRGETIRVGDLIIGPCPEAGQ